MSVKVYRSGPYRQYNQNADGAVIRNGHSMSVPIDSHAWSPPNSDA
jgi:hypothetical protein